MCPDVCLICGKTIQSDDQKSATFFFSLFVLELCNLQNCHSILQLIQGGHAIRITTAALCTFLKVFTVHLVMFHIHLCSICEDIYWIGNWHRAEQLAFTNEGNYIYIFISMFFFFLSSPDCNKLRQTRVFMKIIDKQQKCQMSEMPSHK